MNGIVPTHKTVVRCGEQTQMCQVYDEYDTELNVPTGRKIAKWVEVKIAYFVIDEYAVARALVVCC
jgi:hypothetical protein